MVALDGIDPKLLRTITHLVNYRGPDGYGFAYFNPSEQGDIEIIHNEDRIPRLASPLVGLGHRRLAILDLSAHGNQPMCTEEGGLCITYNGEIYNYLEIREELKQHAHSFKTRTDTEVILHAYQEWGSECLKRFNGMWSFAIWDRRRRRLFCSRDRFGVKPFYYFARPRRFLFGSEIKQILQFPQVGRSANERAVFHYLEQGLMDHSEATFFDAIQQLPAGHFLTLDLSEDSLVPVVRRYWDLSLGETEAVSDTEACEEFLTRFRRAVALRMRSDVPVGSCLSGGLDSSSVVCTARKVATGGDFHTFSSCSEDKALDERDYIAEVVATAGVKPHYVFPQPGPFWQDFERLIWHQEEPVGSTNVYAQWCVMEAAKRTGIPVLLDGQGGDETLCGYQKFYYFYLWHLLRKARPKFLLEAPLWAKNHTRSVWTRADARRYLPAPLARSSSDAARLCQPEFHQKYAGRLVALGAGENLQERQKADLATSSLPALLHYEDRNSMAHSVETRLPFLDYQLAEYLVRCAPSLKLRNGWSKWILREALKGTLPEKVRLRKTKLGFDTPLSHWMREGLQNGLLGHFAICELRMGRFLSRKPVLDEVAIFLDSPWRSSRASLLFRVLNLELWARVFKVS